jgi:hypothetical protein
VCGRIVGKPETENAPDQNGWSAKWTYKIGWLASGNPTVATDYTSRESIENTRKDYCLVAMTDGMILQPMTKPEMADYLNRYGMVPMPQNRVMTMMAFLQPINEFGNTL